MTKQLLDGPGRTLECIHPKFMVDLVQGVDATRQTPLVPQQQQFRERLTQEIMTQTQLRPWAMAGMFSENAALRLGLAEKLAGMFDPGHLALTRMTQKLDALRQQAGLRNAPPPGLLQQYDTLSSHFQQRAVWKVKALGQRGLTVQAGEHTEQILPAGGPAITTAGPWPGAVMWRWKSCAGERLATPAGWPMPT